ncbi:hypothetical protein X946_5342 [Burkholderia sp. ABCPW 111]|nr:hypothetical protein X946_5342 [Burkholderia sp. ABCPW 111]
MTGRCRGYRPLHNARSSRGQIRKAPLARHASPPNGLIGSGEKHAPSATRPRALRSAIICGPVRPFIRPGPRVPHHFQFGSCFN